MSTSPAPRRIGRPPVTSRAQILAAARRIIDDDGWERLTVRRLAQALGVGAPTLYHHVRDREELLILLINQHVDETLAVSLDGPPRERIIAAATTMRSSLADWPWAAEVLTSDGFLGELGDSARGLVEAIVGGAVEAGCAPDEAVHLFRDIWYLTVGEILVRARPRRAPATAPADPGTPSRYFGDIDSRAFPALAAVGGRWPELAAQDTYGTAVAALVDAAIGAAKATATAR
ncbi:TetR/AcrR family transcriptional regulator [Pseudolysinimonas kribbensis]|uniref:TetR/AcrR family transcriptional regulator n=1 Tax=Pseudolysinimonas kribbensis TaxID=433641 RepID=UPI0031E26CA3